MRRIGYGRLVFSVLLLLVAFAATGLAQTPNPNSAVIKLKIWNDSPMSTAWFDNHYPTDIQIYDANLSGCGYANLHNWSFSEDGVTPAVFHNNSLFRFAADVQIEGTSDAEGGLRLSPWWSLDTDGRFMINSRSGEVACFGGRLPFYSFTGNYGVHYTMGAVVRLEIVYNPHGLTEASPATITYNYIVDPWKPTQHIYTSGELAFDEGNPGEDPPHGLWGMLNPAEAGGYFQPYANCGVETAKARFTWANVVFVGGLTTPVNPNTWGKLKQQYK
jgi:hypothetical protein